MEIVACPGDNPKQTKITSKTGPENKENLTVGDKPEPPCYYDQ